MRSYRSFIRILSVFTVSMAMTNFNSNVPAALIAFDSFDYEAGTDNLNAKNGGSGFTAGWSGTAGVQEVRAPGSTYPNLFTAGNKAFISASNQNSRILSAGNIGTADATVWISFIGQRVGANNVRFFGLSFYEGDVNTSANERFTIGENSNNVNDQWGVHFTSAGTPRLDAAGTSVNTESLLLARINYHSAANDDIYLWVNPDLSLGEPALGTANVSSVGLQNVAFDRISIRGGTLNGGNIGEANFDEVRIGDTFADLLSIPEPASLLLMICGAFCVTSWKHRKRYRHVSEF
jgi:hypothetical protein